MRGLVLAAVDGLKTFSDSPVARCGQELPLAARGRSRSGWKSGTDSHFRSGQALDFAGFVLSENGVSPLLFRIVDYFHGRLVQIAIIEQLLELKKASAKPVLETDPNALNRARWDLGRL